MSTSTCGADVKLAMRTLVSGPAEPGPAGPALDVAEIVDYTLLVRRMLVAIIARCARAERGLCYFDFDGRPAALHLPSTRRISEHGFTFAVWIRPGTESRRDKSPHLLAVESLGSLSLTPDASTPGAPGSAVALPLLLRPEEEPRAPGGTVLRLAMAGTDGVLVWYNRAAQSVDIEITAAGGRHRASCGNGGVGPGRWHSLAVCYAPTKRSWSPFGSSNVHVYIDGVQAHKGSHPYIDHATDLVCYIGGSPGAGERGMGSAFSGRIAGIRMFDGVLRTSEIELLHHLGPAHTTQLRRQQEQDAAVRTSTLAQVSEAATAVSLSTSLPRDLARLFQSSDLGNRLILCPDAKTARDAWCLDLSPIGVCQTIARENARQPQSSHGASAETPDRGRTEDAAQPWLLCGEVQAVTATTIHQVMHCLGGVESVLVLLYHLDWAGSTTPPTAEGPLGSEENTFDQRVLQQAPLPSFFYLLRDLLRGSPGDLARVSALNLVPLVARILQQRRDIAQHLTMATLRAMQAFQVALDTQGGTLPSAWSDTSWLWSQVQRDLILNFRIWRRAGVDVQLQHLHEAKRLLCRGRVGDEQGRRSNASAGIGGGGGRDADDVCLGIRWILYSLFDYYPYDTSQHVSQQHLQRARQRAQSLSARSSTPTRSSPADDGAARPSTESPSSGAAAGTAATGATYELDEVDGEDTVADMPGFPSLQRSETRQLRRVLLRTLELFLTASEEQHSSNGGAGGQVPRATRADVGHLVRHLLYACNRDTEHTREVLQLLFRCLADGSPNATGLAAMVLAARGMDVLTHIIECDDGAMAAEALNIVVLLLVLTAATREHASAASRITSSLRGRAVVAVDGEQVSRALALVRTKRALTPALYRALLLLALGDHAALLAGINIDAAPGDASEGPAARYTRHARAPSTPQSSSSSVYLVDDVGADVHESFVAPLPARLVRDPEAWAAALELACAPATGPAMRVAVVRDLRCLLEDEPANYDRVGSSRVLEQLVTIVVLGGYLADDDGRDGDEGDPLDAPTPRLPSAYAKAMGHLELVPHTTLDRRMQTLAVGHIRARRAWVHRRVGQLRSLPLSGGSAASAPASGCGDAALLVRAQAELMARLSEWSQAAIHLVELFAEHCFASTPDHASRVHRSIVALWALTPTGSLPLAVRLLSRILSRVQFRLREEQQQQVQQQEQQQVQQQQPEGAVQARRHTARRSAQAGESLLADNLCRFAGFVLDMLLNYRQFQEYVAYHHDDLRALSESASLAAAAGPARTERDAAYNGQHSPWDDMPALVRELADLMLELGASDARSQSRLCSQTLRLVVSGVRSMRLEQVAESLRYLVLLLERHPGLAGSGGPLHSACDDGCILGQKVLAVLGYVHEAYMFSEEQMEPGDSIGRQYMAVFQCCRGCLGECLGGVCRDQLAALGPEAESLDWDRFARFVKSTEWQEVYHARLMPAMRRTEEEEMQLAGQSLVAFVTTLRELLVGSQRAEAALVRQAKDAQTAVASSTLPIEADEVSSVKADEQRRPYAQWGPVWRQRLQALSAPRGAWRPGHGAARSADADSQQWVLDATENRWRMRRRLAKGAPNEDLRIAADRRDRTGKRRESSAQHQHQVGGRGNSSSDDACDITHLSLSVSGADPADARRLDGEDDWSLVTPEDLGLIAAAAADPATAHLRVAAERIALLGGVYGHVELTQTALRFVVERDGRGSPCMRGLDSTANNPGLAHGMPRAVHAELSRDLAWPLAEIQQVHFRRYMMQRSAVEVFFEDRSSVLLNVPSKKALMQLVWKLTSLPAVNHGLALADIRSPPALLRRLGLTERWQRGELSNFGYLMALNTVAGRSYNDLSQYPVFPWVIRDYTSKWLDLQAPRTYRDLSRPIGAMNEKRLRHFIERYESFEDPAGRIKKFLYGTHYSSAASVAHYMIRLEPFASVHISLQSGKFDHADRQFHSLGDTWNSCMTGSGDVKELIPEFFYLPEFLVNHSGLNLGVKQNGTALGDVCLPPWASTPDEFVRINRQALESEHVSARLHQWIDLIFGFKQRGPEAVKAHNVFYYLTYEDAVDIDAIQDPVERASIESQIHYFGQTPAQLFTAPHPPRRGNVPRPRYAPLVTPTGRVQQFVLQVSGADISFVGSGWGAGAAGQRRPTTLPPAVPWPTTQQCLTSDVAPDRPLVQDVVTAVDAVGRIYMYTIGLSACDGDKLQLAVDPLAEGYYALAAAWPPSRSQQLAGATRRPVAYAVVPDAPELVISCAHLDGSIRCTRIAGSGGLAADASLQGGVPSALGRGTGMTNAYASAVVGAMAGTGVDSPGRATTKPGGTEVSSLRSIAGLFGGAPAGSKHQPGADAEGAAAATSSPPPSTFIPLAARLLDAVDESCCAYLADQQSCIAVSGDGTRVAAGSAQGMVSILALEHATEPGVAGGVAAAAAATVNIASALPGIGVPLLFAAGLADPMNTSLGHTSMAAYSAGSPRGVARRWTLRHVMHGHDAAVLDVAIDTDHDLVASASSDGTVILWAERTGQYLRTVVPIDEGASGCRDATPPLPRHHRRYSRVERVFVGAEATLVCYTVSGATGAAENSDQLDPARPLNQCAIPMPPNPTASCRSEVAALHVFSINGRHLRTRKLVHHLRDVALTRDGRYGACVSSDSRVAIFDTHTLGIVRQFELPGCGRSVVWSGASEQQLVVGCEGGRMVIVSAGASDI
ncbi:hypothetical protein H4R19_001315 [Coemansia spiralis]|nr:hypothetical protein H4R19_001315 [Coemansia spiralis]